MASAGVADFSHFPGELEGMVGIWAMERGAWEVKDGKAGFLYHLNSYLVGRNGFCCV